MSSATAQPAYRLAPYVHVCRIRDDIIILDLKSNQYLGMSGEDADTLDGYVAGFPGRKGSSADGKNKIPENSSPLPAPLTEMEDMGILIPGGCDSPKKYTKNLAETLPEARRPIIDGYHSYGHDISAPNIARFMSITATTAMAMRAFSFEKNITQSPWKKTHTPPPPDMKAAEVQVNTYNYLKNYIYTAHNTCVYTSLSLRRFLAFKKIHPMVVIGVSTRPFKAHCWLQHQDVVFSDTPENVREYTPIFACL